MCARSFLQNPRPSHSQYTSRKSSSYRKTSSAHSLNLLCLTPFAPLKQPTLTPTPLLIITRQCSTTITHPNPPNRLIQPNLATNLPHALRIRLRNAHTPKQDIHLLERQALRLRHAQPDKHRAAKRQRAKEDERAIRDLLQHLRRDLPDYEITHPIRARAQRNTIRPVRQRPHLGDDDPPAGAPAVAEIDDEQPDEGAGGPAGGLVRGPLVGVDAEEGGDDDVADAHGDGAGDHDGLAAELVDVEDCGDGGEEHGDADDAGREQGGRGAGGAEGGEDGGGVVEDGVDTCTFSFG